MFSRIISHLLPSGRAWRLFPGTHIRALVDGLASIGPAFKSHIDNILLDIEPESTRYLLQWERQFGLRPGDLTQQQRVDRLRGEWAAVGGQSPSYIQGVLRAAGYDVYVHEWWIPESAASRVQGVGSTGVLALSDGTVLAVQPFGAGLNPRTPADAIGYVPLIRSGVPRARCGVPDARCGNRLADGYMLVNRSLDNPVYPPPPTDDDGKRWVLYIGGETFPEAGTVEADRRQDFETLLLRICPKQQWIGIIVNYA